jgi:cysteine dioxygenase
MKVLKGSLRETLYNFPDQKLLQSGASAPITVRKETVYHEDEVTYISGPLPFIFTPS